MKTLLAIAVAAVLSTACGGSSDDDSDSPDASPDAPIVAPPSAPGGSAGSPGSSDGESGEPGDSGTSGSDGAGTGDDGSGSAPPPAPGGQADGQADGGQSGAPPAPGETPASGEALALDAVSNDLIVALAGYDSEAAVARVRGIAATVRDTAIDSRPLADRPFSVEDNRGPFTTQTGIVEFDCAQGGRMTTEQTALDGLDESYSRTVRVDGYRFEACRPADDTTLDGALVVTADSRSGSRFSESSGRIEWTGFALAAPSGGLEIDGDTGYRSLETFDRSDNRTVDLSRYLETSADGALVRRIDDAALVLNHASRGANLYQDFGLEVSGTVADASTGGTAVTVSTDVPMDRSNTQNAEFGNDVRPFTGELSMRDEAGSTLSIVARDVPDAQLFPTQEFFVDLDFTGADGTSRTSENVRFADLPTTVPGAFEPR